MKNVDRKLSFDERRKTLTVKTHEETDSIDVTRIQVYNKKGIKGVNHELTQAKKNQEKIINQDKEMISKLKDQIDNFEKTMPKQTEEEKEFIKKLKAVQKYEKYEQAKSQLESQEKLLEDHKKELKASNKIFEEFKQVVKLKL